jgi:hypothetical protein
VWTGEERAEWLYAFAESILKEAREAKDHKTALNAIRVGVDVMAEARQYLELRGELTGELPHVKDAAANVTLIRVLSVPRMPGVDEEIPAVLQRSLPPAPSASGGPVIDAPVDSDKSDIPPRNRR